MDEQGSPRADLPAWSQPGWLDEVSNWIEERLAPDGITLSGHFEPVKDRPWSIVLRVPTSAGDYYFKACVPVTSHEVAITPALYRWRPDCIPAVPGFDVAKGWLLLADGGETLRQAFQRDDLQPTLTVAIWHEILALYAGLQIDLAGRVAELLRLGTPDRRLALLPDLYRDLLAEKEWLLLDQPDGLTTAEYKRLLQAAPYVANLCQKLAACGIPMSLHHNDLHDANIFFAHSRPLFFDWGDSSIAHPFFSLRTVFVSIEYSFDLAEDDPLFTALARSYLQPWAGIQTAENLSAALELAQRLWTLSTAVKYKTQMRHLPAFRAENPSVIAGLLQEFLELNPDL